VTPSAESVYIDCYRQLLLHSTHFA